MEAEFCFYLINAYNIEIKPYIYISKVPINILKNRLKFFVYDSFKSILKVLIAKLDHNIYIT